MATRYRLTKEQVETLVENFVMESAPKSKKPIQGITESQIKKVAKHYNLTEGEVQRRLELIREFDEETFMKRFNTTVGSYRKLSGNVASEEEKQKLYNQAKGDNFNGDLKVGKKADGYYLYYIPAGDVDAKTAKLPWWKRVTSGEWKGK
jgi:hypothetical protein